MTDQNQQVVPIVQNTSELIPPAVISAFQAFQTGQVKNIQLSMSDGTLKISADSIDDSMRFAFTQESFSGVTEVSNANISRPVSKAERLDRVERLYNQGKTQNQIKQYTMTSQKTVSNDIQELRRLGRIK